MPFITRTFNELDTVSIQQLLQLGYSDANYKGTAIRTIIEVVNGSVSSLFSSTAVNLQSTYLSNAATTVLDQLGKLVGLPRYAGESDSNYKTRLSKNKTLLTIGSISSIIVPILSMSTVRDVVVKNFIYGIGTIGLYLVGTGGPVDDSTLALAQSTATSQAAAGTTIVVKRPDYITISVYGTLSPNPNVNSQDTPQLQALASGAIQQYLSSLTMGQPMILAQLIASVINASQDITDFQVITMSATDSSGNTTELLVADYVPLYNQEVIAGTILVV